MSNRAGAWTGAVAVVSTMLAGAPALAGDSGRHVGLQASRIPAADVFGGGVELLEKSSQLSAGIVRFGDSEAWAGLGIEYQYTRYEYEGLNSRNRDLHRLQVPVSWQWPVNQWTFSGVVAPGLATSSNVLRNPFDRLTSDDVLVTARADARRVLGIGTLYLGAAYDRLFGRPAFYPVGGVEFTAGERWRLRLGLPDPLVSFDASPRHSLSARLYPAGSEWHVVTDDLRSEFLYRAEGYRGRVTWSIAAPSGISIDVFAGLEFGRNHRLVTAAGDNVRLAVDDQWLFGIGVRTAHAPQSFVHDY